MIIVNALPKYASLLGDVVQSTARALDVQYVALNPVTDPFPEQSTVIIGGGNSLVFNAGHFRRCPGLRGVVFPGSGVDGIDIDEATKAGVLVVNAPVAENSVSMAEATIMLMLAASYDLQSSMAAAQGTSPQGLGRMLAGKTVGLWGAGRIAQKVADRLQPFGANVIRTPFRDSGRDPEFRVDVVERDELLERSDILSLHLRLTSETKGILGSRELAKMKPNAILINTARGGLIDEPALIEALNGGKFQCVALDVVENEPLQLTDPLHRAPRLLLTPHRVGYTHEGQQAMHEALSANIRALIAGDMPDFIINLGAEAAWRARILAGI